MWNTTDRRAVEDMPQKPLDGVTRRTLFGIAAAFCRRLLPSAGEAGFRGKPPGPHPFSKGGVEGWGGVSQKVGCRLTSRGGKAPLRVQGVPAEIYLWRAKSSIELPLLTKWD